MHAFKKLARTQLLILATGDKAKVTASSQLNCVDRVRDVPFRCARCQSIQDQPMNAPLSAGMISGFCSATAKVAPRTRS